MNVLLINPPTTYALASEASGAPSATEERYPPLGLLYLQAATEQSGNHAVEVIDPRSLQRLETALFGIAETNSPDIVGMTAMTPNLLTVIESIRAARKIFPEAKIAVGGPHADLFPAKTIAFAEVDFVFVGEAEQSFPELLDLLGEGLNDPLPAGVFSKTQPPGEGRVQRRFVDDLDALPLPDRSRLNLSKYRWLAGSPEIFTTMITSRGCPFRCTFCSTPRQNYRLRSVDSILAEFAQCAAQGARHIYFLDDCFPTKGARLEALCSGIERIGGPHWSCRTSISGLTEAGLVRMKKAGCFRVQLGVETSTDEGLKLLGKAATVEKIRNAFAMTGKVGIDTMAYFMLGLPNEKTEAEMMRTVDFAIELSPTYSMFNVLTLYPGTELFTQAVEKKLLPADFWERFAENPDPKTQVPAWTEHMSAVELYRVLNRAYRRFYWRLPVLWRELFRGGGIWPRLKMGLSMLFSGRKES